MATRTVTFEIQRQANPDAPAVWETFELEWRPGMNVISAMMEIAANPVTADGKPTTPITYDSNCLEEICGSCAMRINGKARMACSALVDNLDQPIKRRAADQVSAGARPAGRPLGSVRESEARQRPGFPIDGTYDLGAGPRIFPQAAGGELPALELHQLHLLHGGLPAVQRGHGLCGRGHHRAGQALQQPSHGQGPQGRAVCARWPATAASRSAALRRTASRPAPRSFPSPMPSATSAAM